MNKGHYDSSLIARVRQAMADSNEKLSIVQIQRIFAARGILPANQKGYGHLHFQITQAFKNGILDKSQIAEGRHLNRKNLPKFKVGDKVRIVRENERTPQWLRRELRLHNSRTIVAAVPTEW